MDTKNRYGGYYWFELWDGNVEDRYEKFFYNWDAAYHYAASLGDRLFAWGEVNLDEDDGE